MTQTACSILLPYKNCADTIGETLDSIQAQTVSDYELLAINDHSDKESTATLLQRSASDSRIRILDNSGRGIVDALNFGISQARSDIIVRMDADDIMLPGRLEAQLAHFRENPALTLSASCVEAFPENTLSDGFRHYISWQNSCISTQQIRDHIYTESPLAHPSVAFRKQPIVDAGCYRNGNFPEDYDLWLRLIHRGERIEKLPQVLLRWRDHPERLSRTDERCSRTAFDKLRADYLAIDPLLCQRRHELIYWGAGRITRKRSKLLIDKGFPAQAWIDIDPKKIGNRINGVPVHASAWLKCRENRPLVLVYVANHGAQEIIAAELESFGYRVGIDYLVIG